MIYIPLIPITCASVLVFLIHGGNCGGNPSEGCIVIESESIRYKIKSGATLKVVA